MATIEQEPVTALSFTFGSGDLSQGMGLVPVAVGASGIAERIFLLGGGRNAAEIRTRVRARDLLPGPSAAMSAFASYTVEKSVSRTPERVGKGAIEGVAGPEAATAWRRPRASCRSSSGP